MSQKDKTERWKLLLGTGAVLGLLTIVYSICYEIAINSTWLVTNFQQYEQFRIAGLAVVLCIGLGGIDNINSETFKDDEPFWKFGMLSITVFLMLVIIGTIVTIPA